MKKKFYAFLAMVCVCLMTAVQPAAAAGTPQLSASADVAKADKGQTVKVSISLSGNPGISTLGMTVGYDADAFAYKSCSWNGAIGGNDMKMASGAGGSASLSLVCDKSYGADGVVATLSFEAKKDGAAVDMTLGLREMTDKDLADVANCKVTKAVRVPETAGNKEAAEPDESSETTGQAKEPKKSAGTVTVKKASSSKTGSASAKTDESYKTGVLAGEDVLFVIAAVCGLAAFIFWNERRKEAQ